MVDAISDAAQPRRRGRRITIYDIARAAGVSPGAVSHALNGQRGVSDQTRLRIRGIAADLGWVPNRAAQALSSARAGSIGWVMLRSAKARTVDPFSLELFVGIELGLEPTTVSLVVKLAATEEEELAIYRDWAATRQVDGVLVTDVVSDDPRFALLDELALPLVAHVSGPERHPPGQVVMWSDEVGAVHAVLELACHHGHRSVGVINGPPAHDASQTRNLAAEEWASARQAAGKPDVRVEVVYTDWGPEQGADAAQALYERGHTLILFDSDVMVVAGLARLRRLGVRVPDDVSVVSWVDSQLCQHTDPPVTAVRHDTVGAGAALAGRLLEVISGDLDPAAPSVMPPATLALRDSVAPPPSGPRVERGPAVGP